MEIIVDKKKAIVVLCSGGLDSTVVLHWAINEYKDTPHVLRVVAFNYGQRNAEELQACVEICESLGIHSAIVNLTDVYALAKSPLVENSIEPQGDISDFFTWFVPGREAVFMSVAATIGYDVAPGPIHIVNGMLGDVFQDGQEVISDMFSQVLSIDVARETRIVSPFIKKSKTQVIELAKDLPRCWESLGKTISCYEGKRSGCGECFACKSRIKAFMEAGESDPAIVG